MKCQVISTDRAPAAVGPYSQGVQCGDWVYTAGQIPLDPATGRLVEGSIEDQTRQVLNNLRAILAAAGCTMADVVKTTVFIMDMADFKAMNGVYAEFFPTAPPARSTVQVGGLPLGARVEIEAVAVRRS
jgi:2-iminobutanoate/2-iminopropanoate deaminase